MHIRHIHLTPGNQSSDMQEESDHYLNGDALEAERCSGPRAVFFPLVSLSWAASCSLKCRA